MAAFLMRRIYFGISVFKMHRIEPFKRITATCATSAMQTRHIHLSAGLFKENKDTEEQNESEEASEEILNADEAKKRPIVDVQTSIRYMKSKAYRITYGDALIWEPYRRNHKGSLPPEKTRKTCIRKGVISTGNPCPICRDEYLVLHPENVDLLKQFISPYTREVISYQKTGVCQKQHKNILIAIKQAQDFGYIDMPVPFRKYDYQEYYPNMKQQEGKC